MNHPPLIILCAALWVAAVRPAAGALPDTASVRPPAPALLSPADTSESMSVRPLLLWSRVQGATRYRLEVSADSVFARNSIEDSTLTDTLHQVLPPLVNETAYYWRVSAGDSAGWGIPSETGRFRTGPFPLLSRSYLRFPYARKGDASAASLVFYNLSDRPLNIDTAYSRSGDFALSDSLPLNVLPADSATLTVRFTPRSYALLAETLHVVTALGDPWLIVRGDSPPPLMSVSTDSLRFGPVSVADTVRRTITVRNQGYFNDLVVSAGRVTTPFFRIVTRLPLRIPPGESSAVAVRFNVQRAAQGRFGVFLDTLRLESNGGAIDVPLRGESPLPEPALSQSALALGEVRYNDSVRTTLRITNRSPNTLRIDSIRTLTTAFHADVTARSVRPGDTVVAAVRFAPFRMGLSSDTLIILTNGRRREVRVPLSGASPFPAISSSPASVTFGEVLRSTTERVVVAISNPSINPLTIDSITVRTRQFRVERWSQSDVVRRGDTLRVAVLFAPDSAGRFFDTLTVAGNAGIRRWKVPLSGIGVMPDSQAAGPGEFALFQNYPNPFKGNTTFRYSLPERAYVRLAVYNSLGQELALVEEGEVEAGYRNVKWNAEVASGVYFFKLVAIPVRSPEKQFVGSKRLVILR